MSSKKLTRREFIQLAGMGAVSLALSSCQLQPLFGPQETSKDGQLQAEPDIELSLTARPDTIALFEGALTSVWRYHGEVISGPSDALRTIPDSYLGPIISVNKGATVRIHFRNELDEPSIIHWHGLHVPVEADGHPRLAIDPGEQYTYAFKVSDRAGTYWYHPHPHGRTGFQVYAGMAGLFIIHDEEEKALGLPEGEFDVPLVIQDRRFADNGQLSYSGAGMMDQMIGFLGDHILLNGSANTMVPVKTHPYRFRLLNGSNSRIYKIAWDDGSPLTILGTDGGLLEKPLQRSYITLAPAQRVDLWANFSDDPIGHRKTLVNLPFDGFGGETEYPLIAAQVEAEIKHEVVLPEQLSVHHPHSIEAAVNRNSPRVFQLAMTHGMNWTLNGRSFEMGSVARDEIVALGDTEIWEFQNLGGNGMGMMGGMNLPHPMHVHGLQFQIIERGISDQGRKAWESLKEGFIDEGWHDTVLVMPGEYVRVIMKFEDYSGLYLYHCHNLEHEDMGMMRNFRVDP
jgi:FtsP/CotA-like multicopper oxidase with cupredoxin domain